MARKYTHLSRGQIHLLCSTCISTVLLHHFLSALLSDAESVSESESESENLRPSVLNPSDAGKKLENLLDEILGSDHHIQTREKFLEDNYPDVGKGQHVHPEIFISRKDVHDLFENRSCLGW